MAFSASDFRELLSLLQAHPEWRSELRRALEADDFGDFRSVLRQLAEAQRRTEARLEQLAEAQGRTEEQLAQLTARVDQLAEAQRRTEARLEQLAEAQRRTEERVEQLAEAQRRTEEQLAQLTARVDRLTETMNRLVETMIVVQRDLGELKGLGLEQRYRTHASAYFRPLLRRIRLVPDEELSSLIEDAEGRGVITEPEAASVESADIVLRGRRYEDREETYLAAEISWIIDGHDVERAAERAAILARVTGKPSIAAVAGRSMSDRAAALARQLGVRPLIDGAAAGSDSV